MAIGRLCRLRYLHRGNHPVRSAEQLCRLFWQSLASTYSQPRLKPLRPATFRFADRHPHLFSPLTLDSGTENYSFPIAPPSGRPLRPLSPPSCGHPRTFSKSKVPKSLLITLTTCSICRATLIMSPCDDNRNVPKRRNYE